MERKGKTLLVGLIIALLIVPTIAYNYGRNSLLNELQRERDQRQVSEQQLQQTQEKLQQTQEKLQQTQEKLQQTQQQLQQTQQQLQAAKKELEQLRKPLGNASFYFIGELPQDVNEPGYLQRIENLTLTSSVAPSGTKILTDKAGNNYIVFYWNEKPTENVTITVETVVFREVNYEIFNDTSLYPYPIAGGSIPNDIKVYLEVYPYSGQSDAPAIIEKAKEIAGNLTNQVEVVNAIVSWIHQNIQWRCFEEIEAEYHDTIVKKYGYWRWSALEVLEYRQGVCGNFADLAISFFKALGIPVRFVFGQIGHPDSPEPENHLYVGTNTSYVVYHAWIQVYYPKAGWINYDPGWGMAHLAYWIETDVESPESIVSILGTEGYCKEEQRKFHEYYLVGLGNNRVKLIYTVTLYPEKSEG